MKRWVACPHCGETVDIQAKACRHCGSDDHTGWSDSTEGAVDWNDDEDYADNLAEEFGEPGRKGKKAFPAWIIVSALVLAGLFVFQLLKGVG